MMALQTVSGYEYSPSDLIGHGAFALVFKGRKKKTHELVAIKQIALKSVPGKLSNIRQKEIAILKDLTHPNIVRLYDYVETKTDIFLIMEFCNGGDMGDYLQSKKSLSEDSIRYLARHIAGALKAIHDLEIIHRDIKPQNLLLSYPPSLRKDRWQLRQATVKLADFGFARYLSGTDLAATLCGSPLYMAPEILLGQRYDSRADLWSVGTILFQCHSGTAPFLASNPHALRKKYEREKLVPKIPEGTTPYLTDLLLKLLKKNTRERLTHDGFFSHPFLCDPSPHATMPGGGSLPLEQPSQHTKSSPVPIHRHTSSPSPRYATSPSQRGSLDTSSDTFYSPSSGPPSLHPVGSGSPFRYQLRSQSPHSDPRSEFSDGFIIVDMPGSLGPQRRYSSSPHSAPSLSPASYSSTSRTPSSCGSLTRYASLTTPFYSAPLRPNPTPNSNPTDDGSSSRSNVPAASPYLSRSNSAKRRSSEPFTSAPSSQTNLPFGKLILYPQAYQNSPTSSSPQSSSSSLPRRKSNSSTSSSPQPTPPSSLPPHPTSLAITLVSPASALPSGGRPPYPHGMRYALTPHGSGTKLSSLTEQSETDPHAYTQTFPPSQPHSQPHPQPHPHQSFHRSNSGTKLKACDTLLTPSQLLHSDDEDDFLMGLSMTSSHASSKTDEQEEGEWPVGVARRSGVDTDMNILSFTQEYVMFKATSDRELEKERETVSLRPRRVASFSHSQSQRQTNRRLARDLEQVRSKSQTVQELDYTPTPTNVADRHYSFDIHDLSPTAAIVPFKLPFLFQGMKESGGSQGTLQSHTSSQGRFSPSQPRTLDSTYSSGKSPSLLPYQSQRTWDESEGGSGEWGQGGRRSPFSILTQAMVLAQELVDMARVRQGPIMLHSTDLNDSGTVDRVHRSSEQLVLCAKALAVLESGRRQYEIELATSGAEPTQRLKEAESDLRELQKSCLERAKVTRETMSSYKERGRTQSSRVTAERLLCLEALDICKAAVLDEQTGHTKECIKRYRRAKVILESIHSDATTQKDRSILQNYIHAVQKRIQHLCQSVV